MQRCILAGLGGPLWRWDGLNERLVSTMWSPMLLCRHLWVMVRCGDVFLPVWGARCGDEPILMAGLSASFYWIGPLFNNILQFSISIFCDMSWFLWSLVRCRDVFLPVWGARCGYEAVLMTALSPHWDLPCCWGGILYWIGPLFKNILYYFDTQFTVSHKGAVGLASLFWIGPLFKNILCYFDIQLIEPCRVFSGLWFDVEMYSCRYGGPAVEMSRSQWPSCLPNGISYAIWLACLYWAGPLFKNILCPPFPCIRIYVIIWYPIYCVA